MDRTSNQPAKITCEILLCAVSLLTAITIISPSLMISPVSADTPSTCVLKWGTVDTPGSFPQRNDVITPCEISGLALSTDGKTAYVIDIPDASSGPLVKAGIWRSSDGGISWSMRPTLLLAQASPAPVFPVADIAVSPDDPDFIAAVCMDGSGAHRREVYISSDGGVNWLYSGHIPWLYGPGEQIGSIAISALYTCRGNAVHDIIVGSRNPADGLAQGEIYVLTYPAMGGWKAQGYTGGDIISLMPSPAYTTDSTLVIMSSTIQRTYINLGYRDFAVSTSVWNQYSGWPVELCTPDQAGGTGSGETRIITGSLSLPSDFDGNLPARRIIFAAYDSNGSSVGASQPLDDVYRLNDTVVTRLRVPSNVGKPRLSSIAYSGSTLSGKLLAGSVIADPLTAMCGTFFTSDPLGLCSTWIRPLKAPTGGYGSGFANVRVAWTQDGLAAICGTGSGNRDTPLKWSNPNDASWDAAPLDESAFSKSEDDGISWNQLGLIDTLLNRFRALAVAGDGKTAYVSSVNDRGLDSTWRSRTDLIGDSWQRVLCTDCPLPLLKLSADDQKGAVVFLGAQLTTNLLQSRDGGQTWQGCLPDIVLQDMATPGGDVLFVLQSDGLVRHGKYGAKGWRWDFSTDTGLNLAHTIEAQQNKVLVGAGIGQQCPAAYSLDGGENWIQITEPAYSYGNKHVAFDDQFKTNNFIYLADDSGGLYRWAIDINERWDDMSPPDNSYYGLCVAGRGTLYAAYNPARAGVDRTLYSRTDIPSNNVSWDSLATGLPASVLFKMEPDALICADETIWAIDSHDYDPYNGAGRLWAFKDTLANHSPWLIAPKPGSYVLCDPVTGRNGQVDLKWEQLSLADAYEVEIGKDSWFDLVVDAASPSTSPFYVPEDLLYPSYYVTDGALPEAGSSYYWHVRVRRAVTGQVIRSRWSYGVSFNIRPGYPVKSTDCSGLQSLKPEGGTRDAPVYPTSFSWTPLQNTTTYRFVLATDPGLAKPIIDEKVKGTAYNLNWGLSYKTAYFWQVTPLEPLAGEPSPVFSFTTISGPGLPSRLLQIDDNTTNGLLIALILVILFGLSVQVILYHRRQH
ncbi:MAG: hypothetical protein ABSF74_03080 [Dehalococcoidia bacterium]